MSNATTLRRTFPLCHALLAPVRWLMKTWRRIGVLVAVILAVVAAIPIWWVIQLAGLPDIGDPFDVAAFRAAAIPDDRNAFVLYRQAAALFRPLKGRNMTLGPPGTHPPRWPMLNREAREWVEANRDALALCRRAAERPEALVPAPGFEQEYAEFGRIDSLQSLILIEATRLEQEGDMAGAWSWYRTHCRTASLIGSRGTTYRRYRALAWQVMLLKRLTEWAADPRTSPEQVRQALDVMIECAAIVPSDSYTLKADYLEVEGLSQGWDRLNNGQPPGWFRFVKEHDIPLTVEQIQAIGAAVRFWRREPERCRRLARLLVANRLAFYDLPPDRRPEPDPSVLTQNLFSFGPEAPSKACVLAPDRLDRWLDTTADLRGLNNFFTWKRLQVAEADHRQALVISLATELYRRDHKADPPTPEALVGPYLKSLPAAPPE